VSATSGPDTPRFSEHAASLLGSELWSLLATRSMWWNDASSRTSVFLNVLSASVVALALVADATGFDESFNAFALVLFPIVLFLGVTTYVRLVQINSDDPRAMAAMNRIRHAYLEMAPELERYFTASQYDDVPGIISTYTLGRPRMLRPWQQFVITTPTVVATIDSIIAAAGVALFAMRYELPVAAVAGIAGATLVVVWLALFALHFSMFKQFRKEDSRFPTPSGARHIAGEETWVSRRQR
jgi:hypothetical protein